MLEKMDIKIIFWEKIFGGVKRMIGIKHREMERLIFFNFEKTSSKSSPKKKRPKVINVDKDKYSNLVEIIKINGDEESKAQLI